MSETYTQSYTQKARPTHARVHRVKVTSIPRNTKSAPGYDKPNPTTETLTHNAIHGKNCSRCKESANCVKALTTKLGTIETLVNNLEMNTQKYINPKLNQNTGKKAPLSTQQLAKLSCKIPTKRGIDLSKLNFDDLAKLVSVTTGKPMPTKPEPMQTEPVSEIKHEVTAKKPQLGRQRSLRQDSGYVSDGDARRIKK